VAQAVDLLQIPAFLCRQTDLLVAAGQTGLPVNVKKGQFMAPKEMAHAVNKVIESGTGGAMLTERGHSFGYQDLIADMRGLPEMRALGVPVCMDATHAAQKPGALDGKTGGDRRVAELLARAGVAVGVDALFLEVHEDPDRAPSDGPNMIALSRLPALLATLVALDRVVKES
jgi:2-dehydro-3-deoxyphosphooctonate aldolase (KDO 8-P synthase)